MSLNQSIGIQHQPSRLPVVQIVTLGGTISGQVGADGGYHPALGGADLLRGIETGAFCQVQVEEFSRELSFGITFAQIRALVERLQTLLTQDGVDGVVVTQGTAAMEEVAFLCDLTLAVEGPVVFTGATYHASDPGSDGPHNIRDAIRVAADSASAGRGILVCFAGELFAARDVVKLHKYRATAFAASSGPMGIVDAGGVYYYRQAASRLVLPFPDAPLPRVEVIKVVIDMDDWLLRAALEAPAAGIVIEGLPGSGGVPPAVLPAIREAIARSIPVVLTSRAPFGRITPVAAGTSGPKVLAEMGAIMSGYLSAAKARLLLAVALGHKKPLDAIRAIFDEVGQPGRA